MDSKLLRVGDQVRMSYDEYWRRKKHVATEGNMLAHHTAWGLASINYYDALTQEYVLTVMDPHKYMMKCIEYGW